MEEDKETAIRVAFNSNRLSKQLVRIRIVFYRIIRFNTIEARDKIIARS